MGVVRVALVSMGENISLLDNWYSLPDEGNKVGMKGTYDGQVSNIAKLSQATVQLG